MTFHAREQPRGLLEYFRPRAQILLEEPFDMFRLMTWMSANTRSCEHDLVAGASHVIYELDATASGLSLRPRGSSQAGP